MKNYEKLGAFYLGREYDPATENTSDTPLLYDSRDLTTHAVIIGMTGSGKTGLGVSMLEEAAIDRIPVIAIDPKGDLGNLALTFPNLRADDFAPWVDAAAATTAGLDTEAYAEQQATLWRNGLAKWDQDGERVRRLREAAPVSIYTPGAASGRPLSILGSLQAPPASCDQDTRLQRLQSTVTGLLNLIGVDADPLSSREHILLCHILQHAWDQGQAMDIAALIGAIQNPPITQIGVMPLDSMYPAKDRFTLAMRLNNLLASPGFSAWTQGDALDAQQLLYSASGQPRISVINIAHLSDDERMFVVTMVLSEIVAWMRSQSGTSSLRAILYIDELFGYMPPNGNPASKELLLTLLKQARAFGLGLVLSTQNPVDLDYKGLSNAGTWFIGRLQTEQDRDRVLDGLQSASGGIDRSTLNRWLGSLGKRRFLLHNVHDSHPVLFSTRWAMSYLAGPMSREQIVSLSPPARATASPATRAAASAPAPVAASKPASRRPNVTAGVAQYFLPCASMPAADEHVLYLPVLLGVADVGYTSAKAKLSAKTRLLLSAELDDGPLALEWGQASEHPVDSIDRLTRKPLADAQFGELPAALQNAKAYAKWSKDLTRHVRQDRPLRLWKCSALKCTSELGESEAQFRIRLQQLASERRDLATAKLRKQYDKKTQVLRNRLLRAEQAIEREAEQSSQQKMDAALSFGSALLGAFLGRKTISAANMNRVGTAARRAGRVRKEAGDVARATERAEEIQAQLAEIAQRFEAEVDELATLHDAMTDTLEPMEVRAKTADIRVRILALGWQPYFQDSAGGLRVA